MKRNKIFFLLLTLLFAISLTACTSDDSEDVVYNDGTYYGEGEHREYGYETAEVTIEDGKITNIVLRRMTADGEEVNYEEWTGEDDKPNLKDIREELAQEMIDKQTYEVDAIATATESCEGWKDAVREALEDAK